jgi:carbon monoxide dehydrogenase subunit G
MEIKNEFDVKAPIDDVYKTLLDVERVAGAVPGASVIERKSDDAYVVGIRIRVGPITVQYRGDVEIVEKDEANHRAVLRVKAKETRGQGSADADATMTLTQNGETTHGDINVDAQIRGKVASMGQGAIQDVSNKLVGTFAKNLAKMLEGGGDAPAAPEGDTGSTATSGSAGAPGSTGAPGTTAALKEAQANSTATNGASGEPERTGLGQDTPGGQVSSDPAAAKAAQQVAPESGSDRAAGFTTPQPGASGSPADDDDDDDSLNALDLVGTVIAGRLKEPKVAGGAVLLAAIIAFLIGRATGN